MLPGGLWGRLYHRLMHPVVVQMRSSSSTREPQPDKCYPDDGPKREQKWSFLGFLLLMSIFISHSPDAGRKKRSFDPEGFNGFGPLINLENFASLGRTGLKRACVSCGAGLD